jgi:hypothetical protein
MAGNTFGLQRLPYEIMYYIAMDLTIEEVFDLSLCSRHFQYLIREERFCRAIVKVSPPHQTSYSEGGAVQCQCQMLTF